MQMEEVLLRAKSQRWESNISVTHQIWLYAAGNSGAERDGTLT